VTKSAITVTLISDTIDLDIDPDGFYNLLVEVGFKVTHYRSQSRSEPPVFKIELPPKEPLK
jgi:hypothetical protein